MKTQKHSLKLNAVIKELNTLKMNTINGGTNDIVFNNQLVLIERLKQNPINYDSNYIFQ